MQLVLGFAQQSGLRTRATGYQPKLDEAKLSVGRHELVCDLAVVDEVREGARCSSQTVDKREVATTTHFTYLLTNMTTSYNNSVMIKFSLDGSSDWPGQKLFQPLE